MSGQRAPALSLRGITKSFGDLVANDHVDFDLEGGEVHALLGENGAGKSTLMKIAYGFYRHDAGCIEVEGSPVQIGSPHDARGLGIGMVFQDFTLIPAFSVVENIALFLTELTAVLDKAALAAEATEVSRRFGLSVDPLALTGRLSIGERQKVEVLKLLLAGARILILDEPTSVLAPHEVLALFAVFDRLRVDGYSIVFITHKLPEVLACSDRVTVMRSGRVTGTLARSEATEGALVELMFGTQPPTPARKRGERPAGATPVLELKGVVAAGLNGVDLEVSPGEIVGVAGVSGNGQRELGDVILGLEPCRVGAKRLFGRDATHWSVARVRAAGVAFIPESPLYMAMVPGMTLEENMALANRARYQRHGGLAMDWPAVRREMTHSLERLGLQMPPFRSPAATLSGGTLQRATLMRELAGDPKLLVALYPTHGLDVRSAAAALTALVRARDGGAGVLLISQDLNELFELSDRLLVMRAGAIMGSFHPAETTPLDVGRLMTGAA